MVLIAVPRLDLGKFMNWASIQHGGEIDGWSTMSYLKDRQRASLHTACLFLSFFSSLLTTLLPPPRPPSFPPLHMSVHVLPWQPHPGQLRQSVDFRLIAASWGLLHPLHLLGESKEEEVRMCLRGLVYSTSFTAFSSPT